jgi:hypothetical protein
MRSAAAESGYEPAIAAAKSSSFAGLFSVESAAST